MIKELSLEFIERIYKDYPRLEELKLANNCKSLSIANPLLEISIV